MSKFWDDMVTHYRQGASDLMKTLYPDFPSQWGGDQSVSPMPLDQVEPPKDRDSTLQDRLDLVEPQREAPGKDDRGMERD